MSTIEEMLPITVNQDRTATLAVSNSQFAATSAQFAATSAQFAATSAAAVEIDFDDEDDDSSRKDRVRARTISIKRLSKRELERGRQLFPESDYHRPMARANCMQGEYADRPCAFVSCKYHLYLDVSERTGAIKLNFPDLEVWELPESCALDIADRGGITLEEVGVIMNLTRERIRQLETKGLAKLKALGEMVALQDYCD